MKSFNKLKGNIGEDIAVKYLSSLGYEIIERNWHFSTFGEIDIIAKEKNILIFVEVKTRKSLSFGHPFEAINEKKIIQIKKIANAYMVENKQKYQNCRIDGISVLLTKPPKIEHIKNIFM